MAYRPKTRIWAPSALQASVVSVSELKDHLRITGADEDYLLSTYSVAAAVSVERWTKRLITVRSSILYLDDLPSGREPIELPGGAVASVTSVVSDGVAINGATAIGNSPALLIPSENWPVVTGDGYPVVITYQVGMSAIPVDLVHAIKMIVAEMYLRRSAAEAGTLNCVPIGAEYLMAPHRIWAAA